MKYPIIIFSMVVSLYLFTSCRNTNRDYDNNISNVITEIKLISESPRVSEENLVVLSLEYPFITNVKNDLSEVGSDCFTIIPSKDIDHTLLIIEKVSIDNISIADLKTGQTVQAYKNSEPIYVDFKKYNKYKYCAVHDGIAEKNQTLFIYFTQNKSTNNSNLKDQDSINKLITTNKCTGNSCDLSNADLTNMDLVDANLSGANMYGTILSGANMTNADLYNSKISNANLLNTILDKTSINYPYFSFTNVSGASFCGTRFPEAFDFTNNPTHPQKFPYYDKVDFSDANLSGSKMEGVNFYGAKFVHTDLSSTNIYGTNFSSVDLTGANLKHLSAINKDTDFSGAILNDISIETIKTLSKAKANLNSAEFKLFKWIKDKKDISDEYCCINAPYANENSYEEAYFCSYSKYGNLGMVFLDNTEYKKIDSKSCSSEILIYINSGSPLMTHLCFDKSIGISLDWKDSVTHTKDFSQDIKIQRYPCTNYFFTSQCIATRYLSFEFK